MFYTLCATVFQIIHLIFDVMHVYMLILARVYVTGIEYTQIQCVYIITLRIIYAICDLYVFYKVYNVIRIIYYTMYYITCTTYFILLILVF